MADHGTDIILGGNAEFMARLKPCEMFLPQFIHCTGRSCGWVEETAALADESVRSAAQKWGEMSLTELKAEDHLAYACGKAVVVKQQC
ncbi:unnamed protein product [Sphagnum compactum]